jgi:hypothetical protein
VLGGLTGASAFAGGGGVLGRLAGTSAFAADAGGALGGLAGTLGFAGGGGGVLGKLAGTSAFAADAGGVLGGLAGASLARAIASISMSSGDAASGLAGCVEFWANAEAAQKAATSISANGRVDIGISFLLLGGSDFIEEIGVPIQ